MDEILSWGLHVVRAAQTIASPGLTAFFKFLSVLGTEYFYLLLLPLVYWCIDERKGLRLGIYVITSAVTNAWLKEVFMQPRPYELDPSVGMVREPSYGLPSGHAQISATFWGVAAPWIRKPWGLILALGLPFLVGLSRVYLGVHFPTDVFAGWALGGIFAAVHALWGEKLAAMAQKLPGRAKIILAALAALGMNALNMRETGLPGALFGVVAGSVLAASSARFDPSSGGIARKGLRFLVGIAAAAIIYFGLKTIFPGPESNSYALFRFLRYGLLGAWISLGAPWLFLRLRLAEPR